MILIRLFLTFFKIGAFSFGGGYAMLPFIEREVIINNGWLTKSEFIDILGISQMTPGPVSINTATFVGYKMSGIIGGVFATFGVVITSFILVTIANKAMNKFKESEALKGALLAMRPVLIALIVYAFIGLAQDSYNDIKSLVISGIVAVALFYKKVNPIIMIIISAVLGLIFWG